MFEEMKKVMEKEEMRKKRRKEEEGAMMKGVRKRETGGWRGVRSGCEEEERESWSRGSEASPRPLLPASLPQSFLNSEPSDPAQASKDSGAPALASRLWSPWGITRGTTLSLMFLETLP